MTRTLDNEIVELKFNLMKSLNSLKVISGKGLSFNPVAETLGMQLNSRNTPNHVCMKHTILKVTVKKNKLHNSRHCYKHTYIQQLLLVLLLLLCLLDLFFLFIVWTVRIP